jgi:hypothetical protein
MMATPVTLVDENGNLYTTEGPLFVSFPLDLLTDGGTGPNRRLRVDEGQTGFFAGREFRTYFEFTANTVFKIVVPINTVLWFLGITLLEGECRLETVAGGTEGGTFSTILPIFGRNNMTERPMPYYTPQVTLAAGGTHTGGTVLDVLVNKTSDNSNFAASVGATTDDERGVGPNTYYFRLGVTGTTRGVLKTWWEERP